MIVFIPSYNSRTTIINTIKSVACCDIGNSGHLKIIIYDDCSTDDSVKLINEYILNNNKIPIEVWLGVSNIGERGSCNFCFKKLFEMGEKWVFVIHADDLVKSNWIDELYMQIDFNNKNIGSICCSWDVLFANGNIVPGEDNALKNHELIVGNIESASNTLLKGCWWHFSGCALNLEIFDHIGGFKNNMPQLGDLEFLIRMLSLNYSVIYIPRSLLYYRQTSSSVSSISFNLNRDIYETYLIIKYCQKFSFPKPKLIIKCKKTLSLCIHRAISSFLKIKIIRFISSIKLFCIFVLYLLYLLFLPNKAIRREKYV